VEDTAVVVDEVAVTAAMGAFSRVGEVDEMAQVLAEYRPLIRLKRPARLEGGDVLRAGRRIFVGQGARTDRAGFEALAAALNPFGYRVEPVSLGRVLHLKSAVTALDEETLIINRAAVDAAPLSGFRLVDVPPEEPEAANVLALPRGVCLHAGFRRTIDLLDRLGRTVLPVDVGELIKAESGVTCSSIVFRRGSGPLVDDAAAG
jgi:dimethylargininase